MPTSSSLPRRTGARPGSAALAALTVAGSLFLAAPIAVAAPGDRGDIKIHMTETDALPQAGRPKVCEFYLEAVNFESAQGISWAIEPQPAKQGAAQLSGRVLLTDGAGRTDDNLTLPEGQYKLTWRMDGGMGAGKQKTVKVDCTREAPASAHAPGGASPAVPNDGPNGERNTGPNGAPNAGTAVEPDSVPNAEPDGGAGAQPESAPNTESTAAPTADSTGMPNADSTGVPSAESQADSDATRKGEPNAEPNSEPNGERESAPNAEPHGGPPAGGGGLAEEQDFAPVAGAAAAGLAAVAGAAYFGLRRRRSHGAA